MREHRISPAAHRPGPSHRIGPLHLTDHRFEVPLTHGWGYGHDDACTGTSLDQERIEIFAREATSTQGHRPADQRPWLLYLQGGPGMASPRPGDPSGWLAEMAQHYRVLLLDQRGTGRSTPLSARSITARGDAAAQTAYLEHFRADSIVADAEAIRQVLTAGEPEKRWATLGQSFGGFCTLTYLSFAPAGLLHSWITAGLAPIAASPEQVYQATHARVAARNREFYGWYPEDVTRAGAVVDLLERSPQHLGTGERLTPERLQAAGHALGGKLREHQLHYLLESAFAEGADRLSEEFLTTLGRQISCAGHPLYALMHESIYCDGPGRASRWAAHRVSQELPEFDVHASPLLFIGEMIHPWHFQQDPALTPLADAAEALAVKEDWGRLYDLETLAANEVPVAASAFEPDIFVDYGWAMDTASRVGCLEVFESPKHHHDGLRQDGRRILHELGQRLMKQGAFQTNPVQAPGRD